MILRRKMLPILCGALLPLLGTPIAAQTKDAQPAFCDPGLKTDASSIGYKPRGGNRCEGYYIQPVAGGRLEIASLMEGGGIDLTNQTELSIKWQSLGKEPVHIRAYSLTQKEYYRMDTTRPGDESTFVWPVDLPASRKLSIGLLSWITSDIGSSKQMVYLPVSVGNRSQSPSLRVVLLPSAEASEVYVTLLPVDESGVKKTPLKKEDPKKEGPYPAWKPITYNLPSLPAGRYYAEFSAQWESGGGATARMYFYNPPAKP